MDRKPIPNDKPLVIVIVVGLIVFFWCLSLPVVHMGPVESGETLKSMGNAKKIGFACKSYATDHDGNFPPALDALFPTYLKDRSILVSPFMPSEPVGYIYTPGLKDTSPPDAVIIEDKFAPAIKHRRIVVYADNSVSVLRCP